MLFYGISILIMFIREISLFIVRGKVTPELRLACNQMFYLVAGATSMYLLFVGLKQLILITVTAPSLLHLSQFEYVGHYILMNALPLTLGSVFLVWGLVAALSFAKVLVIKFKLRGSVTS